MLCMRSTACLPCYGCCGLCWFENSACYIRLFSLLASTVKHALCRAQGSIAATAEVDACIRKVQEDIIGISQAQQESQQGVERLMQKVRLSKADKMWLQVLIEREKDQVKALEQLREEQRQLREERMLLLRQI